MQMHSSMFHQMQNHSNEFRYARVLCTLGLIILTVLGLSELGSDTHQESRRRLGRKSQKSIFDDANPIFGLEGKFEFASQKQKTARGVLGSVAFGLGCVGAAIATMNPIPAIFIGQAAGLGASLGIGIETKITYEFKYGPVKKGGKDRVLVKLTKPNKDEEYAYLTDIIIHASEQEKSKMSKEDQERANRRHCATFKMHSTGGWYSRVCNRTIYYMDGHYEKINGMETRKSEKIDFGDIIQALGRQCYDNVSEDMVEDEKKGFTLRKKNRKKFLKISCKKGFQNMLAAVGLKRMQPEEFIRGGFTKDFDALVNIVKPYESKILRAMKKKGATKEEKEAFTWMLNKATAEPSLI